MDFDVSISARFRAARERAALTISEVAERAGISEASVCDLESYDDELLRVTTAAQLRAFAAIFGVKPSDLLGTAANDGPLSPRELGAAILDHCRRSGRSLDQFGDAVGWDISPAINTPSRFSTDFPLEAICDICSELRIHWQGFVLDDSLPC